MGICGVVGSIQSRESKENNQGSIPHCKLQINIQLYNRKNHFSKLCIVSSTMHLKLMYYVTNHKVVTIDRDFETYKRYFTTSLTNEEAKLKAVDKYECSKKIRVAIKHPIAMNINLAEFNTRLE